MVATDWGNQVAMEELAIAGIVNYSHHTQSRPPPCVPPAPYSQNQGCFWPQSHMDSKGLDSQARFDHAPPFKRPRNYDNNGASHYDHNVGNPNLPLNPRTSQPNSMGGGGMGNIFFKTRMCARFLAGTCSNGDNCTFAHGSEDLRDPPPNWNGRNDDQRIIQREKICRKFNNGEECPYGNNCSFLHESPARFRPDMVREPPRERTAISIGKGGPVMEHRSNSGQAVVGKHFDAGTDAFQVNTKPWKTRMCNKWESTGNCPFGDKCHFAHGHSELQAPGAHIEARIMTKTNANSLPTKPIPASEALPTKAEAILPTQERRLDEELFSKWKKLNNINTIYGDWPEECIPPECFRP